jgi:hypothetical protein
MKAYQSLALSAAIAITALQGWLLWTASGVVSPLETRLAIAIPAADAAREAVGAERTDPADAPALGELP